jgi:glycosyltransferase involved in cell wall biosynthesis
MKILHFITSLKIGGAEVALCNLLKYWAEHPDENEHVVAYLYDGPCVARIKKLGIKTYKIEGALSPYDFVSFWRLAKLIKQINPDIIHSALWSANIMARFVARNIPLVCDLHGDCKHHGLIRNLFERMTCRIPQGFVAVSDSVHRSFLDSFKGLDEKAVVIHNGIDAKKFQLLATQYPMARKDLGLDENDFVIGTVGRLHPIKRYDFLIRSFEKFVKNNKTKKLCFVGDGSERSALENLVASLGIKEQVRFFGARENVYSFYPLFDCFVLSSQSEGLSIALLEALCFGLPVITTCENMRHEVIVDGVNGLLISPNDEGGLVKALEKLHSDKVLTNSMRIANVALVEKNFDINRVARKYVDLYQALL